MNYPDSAALSNIKPVLEERKKPLHIVRMLESMGLGSTATSRLINRDNQVKWRMPLSSTDPLVQQSLPSSLNAGCENDQSIQNVEIDCVHAVCCVLLEISYGAISSWIRSFVTI